MKHIFKIFSSCLIVFLFTQCDSTNQQVLPGSSGKLGQLIVVIQKDKWESSTGDSLRAIFSQPQPMLPQQEPMFDITQISNNAFSKLFQTHRNILFCNIDSKIANEGNIEISKNVWSNDQLVIKVNAKNDESLISLITKNKKNLLYQVLKRDRDRLENYYRSNTDLSISKGINDTLGVNIAIPKGFEIKKLNQKFAWVQYESGDIIQGLLIYSRDYTDTAQLEINNLIAYRDQIVKENVPGPTNGSYMTTYKEEMPILTEIKHNDKYTVELRGLWEVENDFMAGPFLSLSAIDKSNKKLITVEGFVYAPKFNKRNYLRQVEAIAFSAEF